MSQPQPAHPGFNDQEYAIAVLGGFGITLGIAAGMLSAFGVSDDLWGMGFTQLFYVGVVFVGFALALWLIGLKPWENFDDLKTPYYTGHHHDEAHDDDDHMGGGTDEASDDLEIIEGIGEKTKAALVSAGVSTFAQLAQADPSHLASILSKAGLSHVKPDTWAKQARYVVDGDAQGFESFRNTLRGTTEGLQQIEGIGDKVEAALHEAGIRTYAQLAHSQVDTLRNILQNAGLKLAKPDTWAKQAQFIVDGDVAGLEAYKKVLVGGVEPH